MPNISEADNRQFKLLICSAGLGMGNASRIVAIIEKLKTQCEELKIELQVQIITWGAGFRFLKNIKDQNILNFELYELLPYDSKYKFCLRYIKNSLLINKIIKKLEPNLILIDSDYHFLSYCFRGIPIISLSQAPDVLLRAKTNQYRPKNFIQFFNFIAREKLDSFFQKLIADYILVPSFESNDHQNSKIISIPLIVRNEFRSGDNNHQNQKKFGILLSGSGIDKDNFIRLQKEFNTTLITPESNQNDIISHSYLLDQFQVIITQGGLSSISEVIARKKLLIVVPIENHPEQIINALEVERLNLGINADISELEDASNFKNRIEKILENFSPKEIDTTGASLAANHLLAIFKATF